jgi:hypothetical protein
MVMIFEICIVPSDPIRVDELSNDPGTMQVGKILIERSLTHVDLRFSEPHKHLFGTQVPSMLDKLDDRSPGFGGA